MFKSHGKQKKFFLAFAFSGLFMTIPVQAIDLERIFTGVAQTLTEDNVGKFFSNNKLLAFSKGLHGAGEATRIIGMQNEDAATVRACALISVLTGAFALGSKLYAANSQKHTYNIEPLFYLYPIISVGKSLFDLGKSVSIMRSADTIAKNNKKNSDDAKVDEKTLTNLLSLLAAETGCSLYAHYGIDRVKDDILNVIKSEGDENRFFALKDAVGNQVKTGATKILSTVFWLARHIYEAQHIQDNDFVLDLDSFDDDEEDFEDFEE